MCAECITAWLKVAGTVLCPCCHSAVLLVLASLRPASLIILLLNDILVQCTSCGRNMRTGAFVGHECMHQFMHLQEVMQIWQVMFLGMWSPTVPLMSVWSKSLQEAELSVFIISKRYK